MITKLTLENEATYIDKVELKPNHVNYFFGSNRKGQTATNFDGEEIPAYEKNNLWFL